MMKPHVIIEISGGVVQNITTNMDGTIHIIVVDYDNPSISEDQFQTESDDKIKEMLKQIREEIGR